MNIFYLVVGGDGEDGGGDAFGAGLFEGLGGRAEGGAGSGHIVDQAEVFAVKIHIRADAKSALQINQPVAEGHGRLRGCVSESYQIKANGDGQVLPF